jgi:replication factor C small subunit
MKKQEHTLWKEKYRSKTLAEYVGNEKIKNDFTKFIKNNDIPDLLLVGRPGTGKTTLAKLLYNTMDCDYIYINASDENGIETIREKVKQFAMTASFKPLKLIVLDEADFLTKEAQAALRNIMETYSLKTRFILTANYLPKIIEALQSRCEIYQITPPSKRDVAQHIAENILDKEKIKYDIKDVAKVINIWYPDIRKTISTLNTLVEGDAIVIDDKSLAQS